VAAKHSIRSTSKFERHSRVRYTSHFFTIAVKAVLLDNPTIFTSMPNQVLALSAAGHLNTDAIAPLLAANREALLCVEQDSELATYLDSQLIYYVKISAKELCCMQRYLPNDALFRCQNDEFENEKRAALITCAKLALFVSGHTGLTPLKHGTMPTLPTSAQHPHANYQVKDGIAWLTLPLKPRMVANNQTQIFFCHRQPCEQHRSTRSLIKELKTISQPLNSEQPNWCQFTLSGCLGSCFPGGVALIHQAWPEAKNNGVRLRFTEQLNRDQWHKIVHSLFKNQPLKSILPSRFIQEP